MTNPAADEPYNPPKPMAVCKNGHSYPIMAGECPYCADTPMASALDADGNERIKVEPPQ